MTWEDALKEDLLKMIQGYGADAVTVESWDEKSKSTGYCDTCYYEYTEVDVLYLDSEGNPHTWYYSGGMAELLKELS